MDHPRPIRLLIFLGLFFSIIFLSNAASANRGIQVAPIYDEAENPAQFVVEPRPMKTGSIEQSKSSKKVETPIPENMTLITAGKFLAGISRPQCTCQQEVKPHKKYVKLMKVRLSDPGPRIILMVLSDLLSISAVPLVFLSFQIVTGKTWHLLHETIAPSSPTLLVFFPISKFLDSTRNTPWWHGSKNLMKKLLSKQRVVR